MASFLYTSNPPIRSKTDNGQLYMCLVILISCCFCKAMSSNDRSSMYNEGRNTPCEWLNNTNGSQSALLLRQEYNITVYLCALTGAVAIVDVPAAGSYWSAVSACTVRSKASIDNNQHSLEIRFPSLLNDSPWLYKSSMEREPLFYYLRVYPYTSVYCNYNWYAEKEDWTKGAFYLEEVARFVTDIDEWTANQGMDFLAPCSHPKSCILRRTRASLVAFHKQAFLRTDFDFSGNSFKDIVVPYYVPQNSNYSASSFSVSRGISLQKSKGKKARPLLLFFAGGKRPVSGLREQIEREFNYIVRSFEISDIVVTTNGIPNQEYNAGLQSSVFCLSIKGDTASSSRLFAIIEAGCIPVIISDLLLLPFETLIDYSKFSIIFPESIQSNILLLVDYLRAVEHDAARLYEMQKAVLQARSLLIYSQKFRGNVDILNPVTLTMVEMLLSRKRYCDRLTPLPATVYPNILKDSTTMRARSRPASAMCEKLYRRLDTAFTSYTFDWH